METKFNCFNHERDRLNRILSKYASKSMKTFMDLDWRTYSGGAIPEKYKELMGLVSSLVLRCDDCIRYHIGQIIRLKATNEEFEETMMIGLIVGGSITIPHIRRAMEIWNEEHNPKLALFGELEKNLEQLFARPTEKTQLMQDICDLMTEKVPSYNWFGFYLTDTTDSRMLVLGPYSGEPTEHTHISFGKGICGQAAQTQEVFIVDDVTKENNYLSCSINVKSEIVLPIIADGKVLGELDIDSHSKDAFDEYDQSFLQSICDKLSKML